MPIPYDWDPSPGEFWIVEEWVEKVHTATQKQMKTGSGKGETVKNFDMPSDINEQWRRNMPHIPKKMSNIRNPKRKLGVK